MRPQGLSKAKTKAVQFPARVKKRTLRNWTSYFRMYHAVQVPNGEKQRRLEKWQNWEKKKKKEGEKIEKIEGPTESIERRLRCVDARPHRRSIGHRSGAPKKEKREKKKK